MSGHYPDDWPAIAICIKDAAGWFCGHVHEPKRGYTLTVHHLDGNKSNCNYRNLVALCQRCHLHVQARYRPGQQTLPGIEKPEWMIRRGLG